MHQRREQLSEGSNEDYLNFKYKEHESNIDDVNNSSMENQTDIK